MAERGEPGKVSIRQRGVLAAYKLLCAVLRLTDVRLVAAFGRCIGYLVWAFFPSRRRIVARNIRIICDPTLRPDKLASMVRRNMVRTSMNLACSLKTGQMSARELERAATVRGRELFEHCGTGGRTGICCIPHAGNWELLARIRPQFDKVEHYGSMYRRMSNPLLEDFVYKSRTGYGCEMFSKEDGLKAVLRLARTGGSLGVLSDQFTQEGLFLPYFGKVTGVTPLPALLYKRCKGKGTLLAVSTRNVALGKWEVDLGQPVTLPEGDDSPAAITMAVNKALETCQSENIMDGFWMHHRWKSTSAFAPEQAADVYRVAAENTRLPFRIIVCMPDAFEESVILVPYLRVLKNSRPDAQLTVICPGEQAAFWKTLTDEVTFVVTTDGAVSPADQLEADELYADGPYDYLFMFSENRRVMRSLRRLMPIFVAGFENNPVARCVRFRCRYSELNAGPLRHRVMDYLHALETKHSVKGAEETDLDKTLPGNEEQTAAFIAPFSSLGSADAWPEARWAELTERLRAAGRTVRLLHLPKDAAAGASMAERLGVEVCACAPEEARNIFGSRAELFAVDGLLPQLAALYGCPCTVLMASRSAERYRPLGNAHRVLTAHVDCHPCYSSTCDAAAPCVASVTVDAVLGC